MEPVTFINCFEVPADGEEEFLDLFREVNDYMRSQPGYLIHRLHRSIQPDAQFRFVNVVQWESTAHWQVAHGEGMRALLARWARRTFPSVPALYEVVDEVVREGVTGRA